MNNYERRRVDKIFGFYIFVLGYILAKKSFLGFFNTKTFRKNASRF